MFKPVPYFRLHLIKSKNTILDSLNSKPYRFNLSISNVAHLLKNGNIQVFRTSFSPLCKDIAPTSKLGPFDKISYLQHIHESPIIISSDYKFQIIYEDNDLVVIDKPSGIPVHPVQRYYQNTVQFLLSRQLEIPMAKLHPVHRLDKLTSGILIFSKNSQTTKLFKSLTYFEKKKEYIAKVNGRFVDSECLDDIIYLYPTRDMKKVYKNAKTSLKLLFYDANTDTSLVSAQLYTGFPHQIRIHLRNLGFPVMGDPLYGKYGKYKERIKSLEEINAFYWDLIKERTSRIEKSKRLQNGKSCPICFAEEYEDENSKMYLHALRYQFASNGKCYDFETMLPDWAK